MNYITQPNITAKYLEIKSTQTSENVFSPVVLSCYYWKAFGDICLLGLSVLNQTDSSLEKKISVISHLHSSLQHMCHVAYSCLCTVETNDLSLLFQLNIY